jgi:hypothetical protein
MIVQSKVHWSMINLLLIINPVNEYYHHHDFIAKNVENLVMIVTPMKPFK